MREVVAALRRDPHECMSETTKVYLGDLYDHIVQVIEIIETYREQASDLTESYRSAVSFRTNEVMVLTVIGDLHPLTFFAGVYGMNLPLPGARAGVGVPGVLADLARGGGTDGGVLPAAGLVLGPPPARRARTGPLSQARFLASVTHTR